MRSTHSVCHVAQLMEGMDILVARVADDQGIAASSDHYLDPLGPWPFSIWQEEFQCSRVVHLHVPHWLYRCAMPLSGPAGPARPEKVLGPRKPLTSVVIPRRMTAFEYCWARVARRSG